MKKPVLVLVACALLGLVLSCGYGGNNSSKTTGGTTGLKFRAVVSQDVQGVIFAGLIVIDAHKDRRAPVAPIGGGSFSPGMLVESNDHKFTLAVSSTFDSIEVIDNVKEAASVTNLALPGATESVVISVDNTTAYAAVPTAPVPGGGRPGALPSQIWLREQTRPQPFPFRVSTTLRRVGTAAVCWPSATTRIP